MLDACWTRERASRDAVAACYIESMTTKETFAPGWQQRHVERYRESNGEDGHIWEGVPTLLLTTTGRRSGQPRTTPLIYAKDGDRYVVVASYGGAPKHPDWYVNLHEKPDLEVQVKADRFQAKAHTAEGDEKARLWKIMAAIWPAYDNYQAKTSREIPIVILERV